MLLLRFFSQFILRRNTVKNCKMDLRFVFIVFLLKWTHAQGKLDKKRNAKIKNTTQTE